MRPNYCFIQMYIYIYRYFSLHAIFLLLINGVVQTWFQNKRSRVLRRLRREPPQDMSDRTSGTRGAGKRDKTATSVPSDHSHKRLCIDTDESTALQPHYNGKTHTPLEEEQHRCIQLPLTTMFTLPAIQSHIPPLPGHLRSTVAAEPGWADCFVYPPPNACFQHQHLGAAATWPSHPEPYSHLMLCLPLASGETYSFSRCVPSPIPRDVADLWRQDLGAHTSGCVML